MARITTNSFRSILVHNFIDMIENENVYIMGSSTSKDSYDISKSNRYSNNFLERVIFGKQILSDDIRPMITFIPWSSGTVYDQYDDTEELENKNFYIISEPEGDGGDYHIFKCLFNNNGTPSITKPIFDQNLYEANLNYIFDSASDDGYIWKYMFSVSSASVRKYQSGDLFPIERDQFVEDSAKQSIDVILVENIDDNSGYEKIEGSFVDIISPEENIDRFIIRTEQYFNPVRGFYVDRVIFVQKDQSSTDIGARQYKITDSGENEEGDLYIDVIDYNSGDFEISTSNDTFTILPRVEIEGAGTGAEALAIVEGDSIVKIKMLTSGEGFYNATASIKGFELDANNINEAILRPVISPREGHGSNPSRELYSNKICISKIIFDNIEDIVPSTNTYTRLGIVKTPEFTDQVISFDNRLYLELETITGLDVGQEVTQQNGFKAIIHEVGMNGVYLVDYVNILTDAIEINEPIMTEIGDLEINNVEYSLYQQRTGNVLYITQFEPFDRFENSSEQIKIIIDF